MVCVLVPHQIDGASEGLVFVNMRWRRQICAAAEGSNKAKINHLTDFTHPSAPPFPVSPLAAPISRVSVRRANLNLHR